MPRKRMHVQRFVYASCLLIGALLLSQFQVFLKTKTKSRQRGNTFSHEVVWHWQSAQ